VENRTGGGGNIGIDACAGGAGRRHVAGIPAGNLTINPTLMST